MDKKPLHPEIAEFSGLFEIGETDLDQYIGKEVFLKKDDGSLFLKGTYNHETEQVTYEGPEIFTVGSVQRIYDGSLALRVYASNDSFGRPAALEKLIFLDKPADEPCIVIAIPYHPSKKETLVQVCRIYIYPVHHTLNNNFVDHLGVTAQAAEHHINNMDNLDGEIIIDFLRDRIPNPAYKDLRGTEYDDNPFVVRRKPLPYFSLSYKWKEKNPRFTFHEPSIGCSTGRALTDSEKNTILSWFGPVLAATLNRDNIVKLHRDEKNRYISDVVNKLFTAIQQMREVQESLFLKGNPPDDIKFVCPECGSLLVLEHHQDCTIDPDHGVASHIENSNIIHCSSCDWETEETLNIVDINLLINKIS